MKEVKTKSISKNIKKIDRAVHLSRRVKYAAIHTKQRAEEKSDHSPAQVYAQEKVTEAVAVTTRQINDIVIRAYKITRDHRWGNRKQANRNERPISSVPPRVSRTLRLKKPLNRIYVFAPSGVTGKKRFIRSRVHAWLLHPSRKDSFPDRMLSRESTYQKPAGKKGAFSVAASHSVNVREDRPTSPIFVSLKKQQFRQLSSRIPSAISKQASHTIKRKERKFKSLSPFIKMGQRLGQAKRHSDNQAEGKMNGVRSAYRTAQMAMTARRSIHRAQAAARFNLRIIQMIAKATALLVKGLAALLGVSSSVIVLLCIVMAIAAVVSSPFGIFVSGENTDADVKPLSSIVQELDAEFAERLIDIQQSAGHVDRMEIHYSGSADNTRMDNWADIIAVFAVKTVMDSENGMDVITLDATRISILQSVFWDMNLLESRIETLEHTEIVTVKHEDGSTSEETTTSYENILHITVTSKTAEQQVDSYRFTNEQMDLVQEMMSAEFRPLMLAILGKEPDIGLTPGQPEADAD